MKISLAQNVRSPEEVDALLAEAERAGATIVRPAAHADWGGYTGALADPDGYVWEIAHNPDWKLGEDGSVHLASEISDQMQLNWTRLSIGSSESGGNDASTTQSSICRLAGHCRLRADHTA